ncbi:MAG: NAD(P)/FAD-dependent oxidoreductase [Xanthobacteraceae bacterium]|jgi:NADH:ubiquinone reductase (H+-translocating)
MTTDTQPGTAIERGAAGASAQPRVVIVGAGFGGLEAARALSRLPVDITVIDANNHHCFQPLLYQVATASLSPADIAWPIRGLFRRRPNVRVMLGTVTGIDRAGRMVRSDAGGIAYDYLILATGATHFYFGHPEWAAFAPGLKRIEDATRIRRRILLALERAEISDDERERRRLMTFVIVGGGPTGAEMAGAIAEIAMHTLKSDFRNIDPRRSRILLIEAGPRILPAFPPALSDYARKALARTGVEIRTSAPVTRCDGNGVALGDERIEAATVIWAAGVAASPAAQWLGAERDGAGRVKVEADLSVPGSPEIFVVGDTASAGGSDKPVPGIAPAAKQMGQYAARAIAAAIDGTARPAPFRYRHYGNFATIGRKAAIADFGGFSLKGTLAWMLWSVAHIYFLIGVRNRLMVALTWIWNYATLKRGALLITRG